MSLEVNYIHSHHFFMRGYLIMKKKLLAKYCPTLCESILSASLKATNFLLSSSLSINRVKTSVQCTHTQAMSLFSRVHHSQSSTHTTRVSCSWKCRWKGLRNYLTVKHCHMNGVTNKLGPNIPVILESG